jgi:predicted secreted protein
MLMKMLATAGLFAGLSLLAGPALADAPKPPKEKKVCRSVAVTGSIMSRSTCHTKDEWTQIDAANAQSVENALNQRRGSSDTH